MSSHLQTLTIDQEEAARRWRSTYVDPRPTYPPARRRHTRRRGPKRVSFERPFRDEYSDPTRDLVYAEEWSTLDVAHFYDVTTATVRQWVQRGYIVPVRRERQSNVFRGQDVMLAHDDIARRSKSPRGVSANIRPRHHDRMVTVPLAARAVGVSPATIRSWIHRGHLIPKRESDRRLTVRLGDVFHVARGSRRLRLTR